jgi:cell division protein FtsB
MKLVSSGGAIHCPHCKRGTPDVTNVASKIEELVKENEGLQAANSNLEEQVNLLTEEISKLNKKLEKKSSKKSSK